MDNRDDPWPAGQPAAATDSRASGASGTSGTSSGTSAAHGDTSPWATRDEGITVTSEMARQLAREQPPDDPGSVPAVTAEWALWGKEANESAYRVLRCSLGTFTRDDFSEVITRYASGVKERLPQYTVCWIPDDHGHSAYMGVAVHELADPDPGRSGGRSRVVGGREVEYVRLFCVRYSEMAEHGVSYVDLAELVLGYQLPAGDTAPILIPLRAAQGPRRTAGGLRPLAENVAALLLGTLPVCVLGAEATTAGERLGFIELVMSLLPYGLRSRLSASTWASSTAQDLKLRLFFANAPRDDGKTSYVTWGKPEPLRLSGAHEAIRLYLDWLRRIGSDAAPALAELTTPMRFTQQDVNHLVDHLPKDRSVTETLEDLAGSLRKEDKAAIATGVQRLRRHLASQDSRTTAADRAARRQVIFRRGMLNDRPGLSTSGKTSLYEVLLELAFDMPLSYPSYCEIEHAVGGPPRGALRAVLLRGQFALFMPWLLAAKAEPTFRDQELMAALAERNVPATTPVEQVARLAESIRPEHRAVVYDFAAHYLRGAADPWYELRERGYLAETLEALFPGNIRRQQSRLAETLRFMYGERLSQKQVSDLFGDSRLHPTLALEQAVRSMAPSRGASLDVARQAAFARLNSAGYGDDALLLAQRTEERYRPPLRERLRQLPREAVTTAIIAVVIAAFVVYLIVTAAYH
jgi:hypothetical protein